MHRTGERSAVVHMGHAYGGQNSGYRGRRDSISSTRNSRVTTPAPTPRVTTPAIFDSNHGCSECRGRTQTPTNTPQPQTRETSFVELQKSRSRPDGPSSVPVSLFQGSACGRPPTTQQTNNRDPSILDRSRSISNSDICTRTSWVDAETAYRQIKRGKAKGNDCALWLRWKIQKKLHNLGCFIQTHCGKVLFLGLLLLSLCCVGLKTASIETNVEKLWVEAGGRLEKELEYSKKVLGEGSGSTHEIVIQTPQEGSKLLTPESLLLHYKILNTVTKIKVQLYDRTWEFTDLCYKPSFPSIDEGQFVDQTLSKLLPCTIITPLDCFWEGSKLLGPKNAIFLPGYQNKIFRWTNLDPRSLVRSLSSFQSGIPMSVDSIQEMLDRAGITTAYQEKPCLNPQDDECPQTSPNSKSKKLPNIGRELTGGCSGLATRYMHWEEDLIVGGVQKDKSGNIMHADAIQSMVLLLGERELYEYNRGDFLSTEWSLDRAREVLQAWQRKFTQEINKVAVTTSSNKSDYIYPFSSASMLDLLQDFSQVSAVRVGLGYALMLVYACISMLRWNDAVQSQAGVGMAGVLLVSLSVAAGLGLCSVLGIKFNASTTQIIPFLALGLGVDDMFLIAHTVAENANKPEIPYLEQTGACLKRVGVSVLLTSLSNACAFFMASIIPIPALRAFCLQAAVLVLFNMATILLVFPAVISLDLIRREEQKVDVLCCITGSSSRLASDGYHPSVTTRGRTPPPDYYESAAPPAYHNHGMSVHQSIAQTDSEGSSPVTVLAPPKYESHNFQLVPNNAVCPITSSLPASTTSSQQCLTPERTSNCKTSCSMPKDCCSWPLTRLARNVLAPLLIKTPSKIFVVVLFLISIILGIIGTIRVQDGLDITDVVPRDTLEYKFLKAQSEFFGFYNFYAVTMKDFDYEHDQQLLYDYHRAFQRVDEIIKKEDGTIPDFWLILMKNWLQDMQDAFDHDWKTGCITIHGWFQNATDQGILGYKLLVQTGDLDDPFDKHRVLEGRIVDKDGIIHANAFYNYLTAWVAMDAMAYYASEANLHPAPAEMSYVGTPMYTNFHNATESDVLIMKSQPIIFSQMAFYLHDLGDTAAITATVQQIRAICDKFAEHGLPNYPSGIIFTFWEQYLSLRFYLMLALICVLAGIFLVLTIVLLNPWTAIVVVIILAMMVVELFGFMGLIGIKLSAVPAVILIVSVGIGVEFTVHICLGFITAIGSRNKRMRMTLEHMFAPVVHGAMTTFLGVIMLALSEFDFIVKYFFIVLTALIVLGLVNGLILLPVLLSVLGPRGEVVPLDGSDFLAPPTPPPSPIPVRREHPVRPVSRRMYPPRIPSEISLTTITEEPSSQNSSRESSQISVHVSPEVVVETSVSGPEVGANNSSSKMYQTSAPSSNDSTPPSTSRHVTTVKATTRVKVEVHTPLPSSADNDSEYKSKKRKSFIITELDAIEPEVDSDESQKS